MDLLLDVDVRGRRRGVAWRGVRDGHARAGVSSPAREDARVRQLSLPEHLQLPCSVAFVHGTEFVSAASHSVGAHGCKERRSQLVTGS